ncbi:hypothetical protein CIK52_15150 [Kocuria rosea]|nr:hypothetical protein CIK52_15150 [Kocuria rosea]QCY33615.1 hypothetical protein EQG70_12705 [Kocuria rosea]
MEHLDAEREAPALDARDLLRLVRTHWRAITLITLLCTLLALGWTLIQPKIYSATASGLVVATGEQDLASALAGNNLAQSKAVSYESLATSRPVAESVIDELDLDATPEEVLPRITTDVPVDTPELRITADAEDPTEAADLANAWVVALASQVQELESQGDEDAINRVAVQPLSNASLPLAPSFPEPQAQPRPRLRGRSRPGSALRLRPVQDGPPHQVGRGDPGRLRRLGPRCHPHGRPAVRPPRDRRDRHLRRARPPRVRRGPARAAHQPQLRLGGQPAADDRGDLLPAG